MELSSPERAQVVVVADFVDVAIHAEARRRADRSGAHYRIAAHVNKMKTACSDVAGHTTESN